MSPQVLKILSIIYWWFPTLVVMYQTNWKLRHHQKQWLKVTPRCLINPISRKRGYSSVLLLLHSMSSTRCRHRPGTEIWCYDPIKIEKWKQRTSPRPLHRRSSWKSPPPTPVRLSAYPRESFVRGMGSLRVDSIYNIIYRNKTKSK